MVLDTLDGFFARLTHSTSAFGVELDSLADVVSFGLAPAILAFTWGLWPLGRLGWAAGFIYVTAAAMRLARFNIQTSPVDRQAVLRRAAESRRRRRHRVDGLSLSRGAAGSARRRAGARDGARAGVPDGEHDPLPQHQGDRRRLAPLAVDAVPRRGRARARSRSHPRLALVVLLVLVRRRRRWSVSRTARLRRPTAPVTAPPAAVTVTIVPRPFSLSTSIVPPLNSMLRRAIGRPRPVPVVLVEK